MGRAVVLAAALCATAATAEPVPLKTAKLVVGGVVEGFLSDRHDLQRCIRGAVSSIGDIDGAVTHIGKNDTLDKLRGLRALAAAFHDVPDMMKACKAAVQDVEQIESALSQIHTPTEFAFHLGKDLLVNRQNIYNETQTAIADWRAHKFEGFGLQVGMALRRLVVGSAEVLFDEFVAAHGVAYDSEAQRAAAFAAFSRNLDHIEHLRQVEDGDAVYSHLSPFADVDPEEFRARHGLRTSDWVRPETLLEGLDVAAVPASFDWRSKGAVNTIKDQKQCGSCWAFATVANIEGAAFVTTGKLLSLSEQELVDCDASTGDKGCNGGLPSNAYRDMIKNDIGLEPESAYPYRARDGKCRAAKATEVAFIKGWSAVSTDEAQIAAALVKYGPLAIGINAATMQFYFGGVAKPWHVLCSPKQLDHGVALVGFGVDDSSKATKYWTIRNSWGHGWGEKGYYRIIRGVGACGLNTMVTTATGVQIKSAAGDAADSFVV